MLTCIAVINDGNKNRINCSISCQIKYYSGNFNKIISTIFKIGLKYSSSNNIFIDNKLNQENHFIIMTLYWLTFPQQCVVCLSSRATMKTYPCGHRVVCRKCFVKTIQTAVSERCLPLKCVVCRTKILKLKQVNWFCRCIYIYICICMYVLSCFDNCIVSALWKLLTDEWS